MRISALQSLPQLPNDNYDEQIPPLAGFVSRRPMIRPTTTMHGHEPTARRRIIWELGRVVGDVMYGDIISRFKRAPERRSNEEAVRRMRHPVLHHQQYVLREDRPRGRSELQLSWDTTTSWYLYCRAAKGRRARLWSTQTQNQGSDRW